MSTMAKLGGRTTPSSRFVTVVTLSNYRCAGSLQHTGAGVFGRSGVPETPANGGKIAESGQASQDYKIAMVIAHSRCGHRGFRAEQVTGRKLGGVEGDVLIT
jgi:hypothetical protein